jgi:hypothetical protein
MWEVCNAPVGSDPEACYFPTSNAICSELGSRLQAVAALTAIAAFNCVLTIVCAVAELRGATLPMRRLTLLFFMWTGITSLGAALLVASSMLANLCSSPSSLLDQNGEFGMGFIFLVGGFLVNLVAAAVHTGAMSLMKSAADPDEADGGGVPMVAVR